MVLPLSYRFVHGFGNHIFIALSIKIMNVSGLNSISVYSKGIKNLMDDEAGSSLVGKDRESSQRDLLKPLNVVIIRV